MNRLVLVTPHNVEMGIISFHDYQNYLSCGSSYRNYEAGRFRPTGPNMIAGSIQACIKRGLSRRDEIIAAVSKSTRCKFWTVSWVLDELTGDAESAYPFYFDGQTYHLNDND